MSAGRRSCKEITAQGKLTDELEAQIRAADSKARLEDLYLPYKPKRRTKAQIAREAGLEPLADLLLGDPARDPHREAARTSSTRTRASPDAAAALDGARAILVERFAEDADLLGELRESMAARGSLTSRVREGQQEKGAKFADYFEFGEPFARLPSHRVLALFRGEKEEILDLTLEPGADDAENEQRIAERFGISDRGRPADQWLQATVHWAWRTRILMHLSVDIRVRLWQAAEDEAVRVFAANLRDLLLAAPAGRADHDRPRPRLPHRRQGRGHRRHRQGDSAPPPSTRTSRTAAGTNPSTPWPGSRSSTAPSSSPSATAPPRGRPTGWPPT